MKIITGNIFDAKEKYICHQCNCLTRKAAHLSKDMFQHFPYADIYKDRTSPDIPGTIIIRGNGKDQRYVINILGQYYPGKPKFSDSKLDGFEARQKYFYNALLKIANIDNLESVAFPVGIACGAAGGDWNKYSLIIENFSKCMDELGVETVMYYL